MRLLALFFLVTGLVLAQTYENTNSTYKSPFQTLPTTTNPGCTTAADLGKLWLDSTTTSTAYKICLSVSGTPTWSNQQGVAVTPAAAIVSYRPAICQGTTAYAMVSLPATNPPVATCVTGTNTNYGVLKFSGLSQTFQDQFRLPANWAGGLNVEITYRTQAVTGNVVLDHSVSCTADGTTGDAAFTTAQTLTSVVPTTAYQYKTMTLNNATVTGCAVNSQLNYKIGINASTTAAYAVDISSVRYT
jgi:hypothetical protein